MTVQCPRCRTQYKVPNARISDPRPVFKCTRCSLVFSREAERPSRSTPRPRDERNLALPFGTGKETERRAPVTDDEPTIRGRADLEEEAPDDETAESELAAEDADEASEDEAAAELEDDAEDDEAPEDEEEEDAEEVVEPEAPPRRAAQRPAPPRRTERTESRAPGRDTEPAFVAASRERSAPPRRERRRDDLRFSRDDEPVFEHDTAPELDEEDDEPRRPVLVAAEGKQRRAPITPRRGAPRAGTAGRSPLRPVAIGVGAITAAYLGLAVALDRRPAEALETLSSVPVLGRLLGGDHLLLWRLQLANVEGGLDHIKGGRPAYVVSGRAINTSNEDLRIIEVEGRLLVNGVEQRRQVVYAANQPRKTIRDLSPSEVEMLLRLEPNRRFVIRPGESASFLLVFPDPPRDTTEVTCRVVNARPA